VGFVLYLVGIFFPFPSPVFFFFLSLFFFFLFLSPLANLNFVSLHSGYGNSALHTVFGEQRNTAPCTNSGSLEFLGLADKPVFQHRAQGELAAYILNINLL